MAKRLLNQQQYADHRKALGLPGQTRQAVNKRIKAGDIKLETAGDGTQGIDPEKADAAWGGKPNQPGADKIREPRDDGQAAPLVSLNKIRAKSEGIKALKLAAELDRMKGRLVERRAVASQAFAATRITRDQLRGMPAKLAYRLANVTEPVEAEKILREEVDQILRELARKFQELPNAGADLSASDKPAA